MGSCVPFADDEPFAQRVKSLADDELLEIWEETQQIETILSKALHADLEISPEYEKAIVEELFVRSGRRLHTPPAAE
ncbi:MAG: hypothetical protein J5861_06585 [Desulfovibrio sp.]|nr:hypothetical protein [Desulfovibrio sp.]